MGYTALLFCPDDKTARTVTQVLSELEFTVEACIEPFAAVKKLMGIHFDAVVVDCDNEQNATLLFKSARNSTSNQTSLAVAVVEGQAGVAKAFRIGANLVLTKPINIEQAKGTLRVARGLLRKSDPAKPAAPGAAAAATPAAPAPTPAPVAAKPAATRPIPAAKPAVPKPVPPVPNSPLPPRPVTTTVAKPAATQAWPAAASAASKPAAQDDDLLGIEATTPQAAPAPAAIKTIASPQMTPAPEAKSAFAAGAPAPVSSGAASAPAPAREPQAPAIIERPAEHSASPAAQKPAEATASEPSAYVGAAPTFGYGASTTKESSGGNKKIFIGIGAAAAVVVLGLIGWTQFKGHGNATPAVAPPTTETTPQTPKPSVQPAPLPMAPQAAAQTAEVPAATPTNSAKDSEEVAAKPVTPKPSKASAAVPPPTKDEAAAEPEPAPMVVKGGKAPVTHTDSGPTDAPAAPSMAGMAAPGAAPPPDLMPSSTTEVKPLLQTLSISQGVSQGLLYKKVSPTYPPNAIRMRIEGTVELQATISKTGDITLVKVLKGDPLLAQAAMEAVKKWKYKPYLLNGEPVEIQTQVTVNFKLPQ